MKLEEHFIKDTRNERHRSGVDRSDPKSEAVLNQESRSGAVGRHEKTRRLRGGSDAGVHKHDIPNNGEKR